MMRRLEKSEAMRRGAMRACALLACALLAGCADDPSPNTYLRWNASEARPHNWPSATYYTVVVRPHDTVAAIAARYDVSEAAIRRMNGLAPRDPVAAGDVLRIPPGSERTRAIVLREAGSQHIYAEPHDTDYVKEHVESAPLKPVRTAHAATPVPRETPAPARAEEVASEPSGAMRFIWPVSGHVVEGFGSTASGERNDGINIAADEGAQVRAAAAGTVTYAGNELHQYGNLVIIKHEGGYITVYAHEQSLAVQKGDQVSQGQVIGTAGTTGGVDQPEVHFEVRYDTRPVNPRPLLSQTVARAGS